MATNLTLLGCTATGDTSTTGTPPASDRPVDVAANSDLGAALDQLPVPAGASTRGDPIVAGNTIEQTWSVQDTDVQTVFDEVYVPELETAGWTPTTELTPVGNGWAQSWQRDEMTLKIVSEEGASATQIITNVLLTLPESDT